VSGHDFSRAVKAPKHDRALAPEGCLRGYFRIGSDPDHSYFRIGDKPGTETITSGQPTIHSEHQYAKDTVYVIGCRIGCHCCDHRGIAAENGEFAFLNDLITAYSGGNIRFVQGAGEKWNYVQIAGKSASFEVKNLSMRSVSDNVPIGIAHEFSFCDSFDQVSRPVDSAFRAVLPKGAKVKAEEDYGDGQTLVIYTVPVADHYLIDFTLIESTAGKGYSVVGTVPVSEYGDYCGMQAVTREIRAVMVDEPAGSSDYSAVYLFAVRTRKAPEK